MTIILPLIIVTLLVIGFFRFKAEKEQESQLESEGQNHQDSYETPQKLGHDSYQEASAPVEEDPAPVGESPVEEKSVLKKKTSTAKSKKSPAKKESPTKKTSTSRKTTGTKKTTTKKSTK